MILLKLKYFDLISPVPILVQNVGHILSPTLYQISQIGIDTYNYYLSIILTDVKTFFNIIGQPQQYETFSDIDKESLNIFDLFLSNEETKEVLKTVMDFFIVENVVFYEPSNCFIVTKDKSNIRENIIGVINCDNYIQICDLICQLNNIKTKQFEDLSKVKGKALEIFKKIQKARENNQKKQKNDKDMELGNIISAVANKHPSLNMTNIWELTVYQLWDSFARLFNNSVYDIQSMSVAAWGDEKKHFDATAWFKKIDTEN